MSAIGIRKCLGILWVSWVVVWGGPTFTLGQGDPPTHESDHLEDEDIQVLETIHVHGLKLNKDQQHGPIPTYTPWPTMPVTLEGKAIDDWIKIRITVNKNAMTKVIVLEPAHERLLTLASLTALEKWTFKPQMQGDQPINGELTVRIHFRNH